VFTVTVRATVIEALGPTVMGGALPFSVALIPVKLALAMPTTVESNIKVVRRKKFTLSTLRETFGDIGFPFRLNESQI
jgi:hypothetical protein